MKLFEGKERMDKFQTELESFIDFLKDEEIKYAVVGGVAYSHYAKPRATQDLDFYLYEDDFEVVKEYFDSRNMKYQTRGGKQIAVQVTPKSGIKSYDLIFAFGVAPYSNAIKRAKKVKLFGVDVMMATPEDLVALWCDAWVDGHHKVLSDIREFIKAKKINIERTKELLKDIGDFGTMEPYEFFLKVLNNDPSIISEAASTWTEDSWSSIQEKKLANYYARTGRFPHRVSESTKQVIMSRASKPITEALNKVKSLKG